MKRLSIIQHNVSKEGGTEKYWYYLIKGLLGSYDISVFGWKLDSELKDKLTFTRMPSISTPTLLRFLSELIFNTLYRSMMKIKSDITDITHCSGPDVLDPDICTAHVCQRARLNAVGKPGTIRKGSIGNFIRKMHFALLLGTTALLEGFVYRKKNTKRIICVSQKVKDELMKFYRVPYEKLVVIPNGVDSSIFNTNSRKALASENREKLGFTESDFVISFITSDWERKGFHTLLKAMSMIDRPNLKLLAVGCSERDHLIYSKIANDLKLADKIVFKHFELDIRNYYSATDLLVHPSYYDSFGLVPLECMAMGIPVLVSRATGISQWISDGENGFIFEEPSDENELSQKLKQIIANKELSGIAEKALHIAKELNWEMVVRKTAEVYQEVLQATHSS